jgi:hypothetical protein
MHGGSGAQLQQQQQPALYLNQNYNNYVNQQQTVHSKGNTNNQVNLNIKRKIS